MKRKHEEGKKWRWGIMGAGRIANDFVCALQNELNNEACEVVAVGARSADSASEFAKKYKIPNSYGSYKQVAEDKNVEVVYVSTIHPSHFECCRLALSNGKHVLCEKPLTLNAKEAHELADLAKKNNCYFQEAMWTRDFPIMVKIRELLKQGAIGDVVTVHADFGFKDRGIPRLSQPELGGGALLDIGVYVIAFASMIFGPQKPNSIKASGNVDSNNVDHTTAIILTYGKNIASLFCTIESETSKTATIYGSKGSITVQKPFWCPEKMILRKTGEEDQEFHIPHPQPSGAVKLEFTHGNAMVYQVKNTLKCLNAGLKESPTMTIQESLNIMEIMDEVRKQIGVFYPNEKKQ